MSIESVMLSKHYLALAGVYPNRWISKDPNAVFLPLGDVCSMKNIRHPEEKTLLFQFIAFKELQQNYPILL